MSVDLAPQGQPRSLSLIADVFIIIGGYASEDIGRRTQPLPPTPSYSGTGDLYKRVLSDEVKVAPGHVKRVIGLKGTLIDDDLDKAYRFFVDNFDPRGKVIVYGHSIGGAAVLELCRMVTALVPYYSFETGLTYSSTMSLPSSANWDYRWSHPNITLTPPPTGRQVPMANQATPPETMNRPLSRNNAVTRIDLLVTVDAARGPWSSSLNRSIAECVRTNLNYYQTTPHGTEKSFGGPNEARDNTKTVVWNHDLTGRSIPDPDPSKPPSPPTHITIDDQTNNTVIAAIQKALLVRHFTEFMDVLP